MFDLKRIREAVRYEGGVSRRLFLSYGSALAALPTLALQQSASAAAPSFKANPFSVGVASGDPDERSFVIWTRLAPTPLDPDGGMPAESVAVRWEVADDDKFAKTIARGTALATPQLAHSVHIEVSGLAPDRWYFYRFTTGDATSPVGRARTMPAADATPERLKIAFASCQHYEQGLFNAYRQMAADGLDLVFHLGDYIYEYPGKDNLVRKHAGSTTHRIASLADYRVRHAQYKTDALLSGMHAQCPWFVTWDDHEFENNYAGEVSEIQKGRPKPVDPVQFLEQRANAYQAYYEAMPLRARALPSGPDMLLYRKATFGRLAEFLVLDTRQYRTDQPNGDGGKPLNAAALDPRNSLLGAKQRGWLQRSWISSTAKWNVLAQQVMMGLVGRKPRDGVVEPVYSMDQWPGAAYERMALMRFAAERRVPNPVVLTGDIHTNWVNNLRVDDRKPETPVVATEFVGTSISSGGNGRNRPDFIQRLMSENPGVRFHNQERGYVRCEITPKLWKSDYVVAEDVTKPDGKVVQRASFVVEAGKPGAEKA